MYKKFFTENLVVDKRNKTIGLSNNKYHFHVEDMQEGMIPIEMIKLNEVCQILDIDVDQIPMEKLMECYSKLYEILQVGFEAGKQEITT